MYIHKQLQDRLKRARQLLEQSKIPLLNAAEGMALRENSVAIRD